MIKSRIGNSDTTYMSAAKELEFKSESVIRKPQSVSKQQLLTIKNEIVALINADQFEEAKSTLKAFSDKPFPYKNYRFKIERYVSYALDLILALDANKNFAGFNSLTRSKQQELKDKYKKNFSDLKDTLNKIEMSYYELKFKDIQSTGYFVKAFWVSLLIISSSALVMEIFRGLGGDALLLISGAADYLTEIFMKLFS